jgi:hypothetical protein
MASYLVEVYVPRVSRAELRSLEDRLRGAADAVSRSGTPVRHVRSVHVPDDETCFHFFEAASATAVHAAGRGAGVIFDRVAEAVT